jgi:hypothetical protein
LDGLPFLYNEVLSNRFLKGQQWFLVIAVIDGEQILNNPTELGVARREDIAALSEIPKRPIISQSVEIQPVRGGFRE